MDQDFLPSVSGRPIAVHSAFAHAVNLEAEGVLVSVLASGRPAAPRSAILDLPSFSGLDLAPGMPVAMSGEYLEVPGQLMIDLRAPATWHPPPLSARPTASAVAQLRRLLADHPLGGRPQDKFGRSVTEALTRRTEEFVAALADDGAAPVCAARLLGLGFGLTPSGDDWLTGFGFAAAWLGGPLAPAVAAISTAARPGTTLDLSLSAIHLALDGRAIAPLHHLLTALAGSGGPAVERALSELSTVGHTSGIDMAHGLCAAVHISTSCEE